MRLGCNLRESDLPAPVSCSQNHLKSHRLAADFAFTAEAKIESKQHHESQFTIPNLHYSKPRQTVTDCHMLQAWVQKLLEAWEANQALTPEASWNQV